MTEHYAKEQVKVNMAALSEKTPGDYLNLGLFSNVQNFGSGWRVLFDHGAFLILEGETADGRTRQANISRDCIL